MVRTLFLSLAALLLVSCGPPPDADRALGDPAIDGELEDGVLDLRPARLDGSFGVADVDDRAAVTAEAVTSSYDTELYFDFTDEDGAWSMVRVAWSGRLSDGLPSVGERVDLIGGAVVDDVAGGVVCSRSEGHFYDRAVRDASITVVESSPSATVYELQVLADGADARARFSR